MKIDYIVHGHLHDVIDYKKLIESHVKNYEDNHLKPMIIVKKFKRKHRNVLNFKKSD